MCSNQSLYLTSELWPVSKSSVWDHPDRAHNIRQKHPNNSFECPSRNYSGRRSESSAEGWGAQYWLSGENLEGLQLEEMIRGWSSGFTEFYLRDLNDFREAPLNPELLLLFESRRRQMEETLNTLNGKKRQQCSSQTFRADDSHWMKQYLLDLTWRILNVFALILKTYLKLSPRLQTPSPAALHICVTEFLYSAGCLRSTAAEWLFKDYSV